MTDEHVDNGAGELDLDEAGKLAYAAVVRRLKNDETTPLGATALARFAQWHMDLTEERRRREEASRPDPQAAAVRVDHFLEDLIKINEQGGLERPRLREILAVYIANSEEQLETARAFAREIADEVSDVAA